MTLNYKYTLLYIFITLFLFWLIIKYGSSVKIEGFQQTVQYPKDASIDYNDRNSPLYSQTVDLPLNNPVSCQNFCGPKSQCAITREQCSSDIDCQGCNPGPTPQSECITKDVSPYDDAGKLGQNQLQYSPLTTGYNGQNINFAEAYPGSKDAQIQKSYEGINSWTNSFNKGLQFYNLKRESADKYSEGYIEDEEPKTNTKLSYYEPRYPTTISATGQFYETTPPASNSTI
jgi:hypothetical protein